mmetsp:Transcript_55203/g.118685  ORF Transcript_55203/g.118685 Transcript_55203/m.118685 type:complete len:91 (+) Transcript_55203:95-367(+)
MAANVTGWCCPPNISGALPGSCNCSNVSGNSWDATDAGKAPTCNCSDVSTSEAPDAGATGCGDPARPPDAGTTGPSMAATIAAAVASATG